MPSVLNISIFLLLILLQQTNATNKIFDEFQKKIQGLQGKCLQSNCKKYMSNVSLCEVLRTKAPEANIKNAFKQLLKSFNQCQSKRKICGQCYRNMVLPKTGNDPHKVIKFDNVVISHVGNVQMLDGGHFRCVFAPDKIQISLPVIFPKISFNGDLQLPVKNGSFVNDAKADKITINKSKVQLLHLRLTVQLTIAIKKTNKCEYYNVTDGRPASCPSNGIKVSIPAKVPIRNMNQAIAEVTALFEKSPYRPQYRKSLGDFVKRIVNGFINPCKPC